jgi:hypothetical protein
MQQRVKTLWAPYDLRFLLKSMKIKGFCKVPPNLASLYRIEVSDYFGNKRTIFIPIHYDLLPRLLHWSAAVQIFCKS